MPVIWALILAASVALDVPSDALGERIVLRLLDEGWVLVPRDQAAAIQLRVGESDGRLFARARGIKAADQEIEAEPRAVAELELLQRAVIALENAGKTATTSTVPVVHLIAPAAHRGRLALAVLESGFAVTQSSTGAKVTLCASAGAYDEIELLADDDPNSCARGKQQRLDMNTPWAETIGALIRDAMTVEAPIAATQPPLPAEPRLELFVSAGGGAIARAPSIDPTVSIGLAIARRSIGARLDLDLILATRGEVSAQELIAVAGPFVRFELARDWSASIAARAGILAHNYDVTGSTSGTHFDFTAGLAFALLYQLNTRSQLSLELDPAFTNRRREHLLGEQILWSRSPFRLGIRLALRFNVAK